MSRTDTLGVVCDYHAEQWPSMDLFADLLLEQLAAQPDLQVQGVRLEPAFQARLARLPLPRRFAHNVDRLWNRWRDYPDYLKRQAETCRWFHVCDHSYAHLVHSVPAARTGVYCHDLDAFRSILEPHREQRPWWFRRLAKQTLAGMRAAAVVFHNSLTVRDEILAHNLVAPAKLVHAPPGIAAEFSTTRCAADAELATLLPWSAETPVVLHVGSCIPRKRIDVLLQVVAAVRALHPAVKLLQCGGTWTGEQAALLAQLGLVEHTVQIRGVARAMVAACYRIATVALQPSEAEGFGLPVIEALACGAPVVASNLPVLCEVGGTAAQYAPVADIPAWTAAVSQVLNRAETTPGREIRLAQAARYSWATHARTIAQAYRHLDVAR